MCALRAWAFAPALLPARFLLVEKIETILVDFWKYVVKIVDESTVFKKVDKHGDVKFVKYLVQRSLDYVLTML